MLQKALTWDFASRFVIKSRRKGKNDRELGRWTRERLIHLGPTFVKLGQLASTRRDVFSVEFIEELESLQDQVPPISSHDVGMILTNELAQPVENIFSDFDYTPFKSASLGQVHQATLNTGVPVMVKLQRPDIRKIIQSDIQNITEVLVVFDLLGIDTGPSATELFLEATTYLYQELDYIKEANNARIFYTNFYTTPWVRVPRVYSKVLTEKLMVMERVDSVKITDVKNGGIKVSKALVNSFLTQLMVHGFFHGDPHPGNVGVSAQGELVYYDFGLMVQIDPALQEGLVNLVPCILQRDTRKIVDILIDLGIIVPTADKSDIVAFFEAALDFLSKMDGKEFNAKMAQDELSRNLSEERPFIIPSNFLFLAKSLVTIDGICQQLDPNFNFITYIEPMIENETPPIDVSEITRTSVEMPGRVRSINEAVNNLERSRTSMKRGIERTRKELKSLQYSMVTFTIAQNFHDQPVIFWPLVALSTYFIIR